MAREMSDRMKTYLEVGGMKTWYDVAEQTGNFNEMGAFLRGLAAGVLAYAWWKDGVQFVGSCGSRLTDAVATINDETERLVGLASEWLERTHDDGATKG